MSYCGFSGLHFLMCFALYQMNFSKNILLFVLSVFCLQKNLSCISLSLLNSLQVSSFLLEWSMEKNRLKLVKTHTMFGHMSTVCAIKFSYNIIIEWYTGFTYHFAFWGHFFCYLSWGLCHLNVSDYHLTSQWFSIDTVFIIR